MSLEGTSLDGLVVFHEPLSAPIAANTGGAPNAMPREQVPSCGDEFLDDLPPVFQFPVVEIVKTRFKEGGDLQPLPFPEWDD